MKRASCTTMRAVRSTLAVPAQARRAPVIALAGCSLALDLEFGNLNRLPMLALDTLPALSIPKAGHY
jgi:hypothetical protein